MGRGSSFDPLEPTQEPRWYEVRNMHNALLEARLLPPGSDLKRAFVAAMVEWIDAGWTLGGSAQEAARSSTPAASSGAWSASLQRLPAARKRSAHRT
jgi:hypothetical protein